MLASLSTGAALGFSQSDDSLVDRFSKLIDDIALSFEDFMRPEFCKVRVLTQEEYNLEREDSKRQRKT